MTWITRDAPRIRRGLRHAVLGGLALLVAATGLLVTPLPAQAEEATKVHLLLDVSGSMNERSPPVAPSSPPPSAP